MKPNNKKYTEEEILNSIDIALEKHIIESLNGSEYV